MTGSDSVLTGQLILTENEYIQGAVVWTRIEGVEYKSHGRSSSGHLDVGLLDLKEFSWVAVGKYGSVFLKGFV